MSGKSIASRLGILLVLICTVACLLQSIGCGSGGSGGGTGGSSSGGNTGRLVFDLPFPSGNGPATVSISGNIKSSGGRLQLRQISSNVAYYIIHIYERGTTNPVVDPVRVDKPSSGSSATATIDAVPIGWKTITIQAYDASNTLIEEGSTDVEVQAGDNNQEVDVIMTPVSSPPQVVTTSPTNGATDVDPAAPITATFSKDMDASSITTSSFYLDDPYIQTSASLSGTATAVLTPLAPLPLLSTFNVTITTAVKDTIGTPMESDFLWSFTTHVGSWQGVGTLGGNLTSQPRVAIDSRGDAIVAWYNANLDVYANYFDGETGAWKGATSIESGAGNASGPSVGIDDNGNATVVWSQVSGGTRYIYRNTYTKGSGWGTETTISTFSSDATSPRIAMNPGGDAVVVWLQNKFGYLTPYAADLKGGVWGSPVALHADMTAQDSAPRVAIDSGGNAVAIWKRDTNQIFADSHVVGGSWGGETFIGSATFAGEVAISDSGKSTIVWIDSSYIWASASTGGGWTPPERISTLQPAFGQRVAMDPFGNAIAVWYVSLGAFDARIMANRLTGSGWGAEVQVTQTGAEAYSPSIGMDRQGNAHVVFNQGSSDVYDSHFLVSSLTWGAPVQIDGGNTGSGPEIAVNPGGYAVSAWSKINAAVYANQFR